MKTSNKFTLVRILFAPVFLLIFFLPEWTNCDALNPVTALVLIPLFAFVEFTDFLDGYYARKHNEVSDFGKLFDPFADVVFHLTTFSCCVFIEKMPVVLFMFIVYREFGMNFVRMVAAKQGIAIAARKGGKFKTVLYIVSAAVCLFAECLVRLRVDISPLEPAATIFMHILFVMCLIASYASFIDYLVAFKHVLKKD